jgi:hypothetical protein
MPLAMPAAARIPASCPAPEASSTTGSPRSRSSSARAARTSELSSTGSVVVSGSNPIASSSRSRPARSGARASTLIRARPGTTLDLDLSDRCDRAGNPARSRADSEHGLGGGDERVLATLHRRRAGVPRPAFEHELAPRIADDPGDDSERGACALEHRPLLDVQLEEDGRELDPARAERAAADAADLLAPERDDRPGARPLDGLEPRDDAECAVEASAPRDAVQVRPDPDARCDGRAAEQVPRRVRLHLQSCLAHPLLREGERLVLRQARMRTVRAGTSAQRVEPVEPVEEAHAPEPTAA